MSRWTPERRADAQSDQCLAALARTGDPEAFAAIVARYHGPLLGMAHRLCSDGHSEDVVQQTFLAALVAFRSGTEVRHLRGWLHQILRHAAQRAPGHVEITLDPDREVSATTVEEDVERRLATRQVLEAMAALPSRQRDAMVATAIDGQSRSAVADAMGLSEGAVRQLMHRARQTLRAAAYAATPWPLQRWLTPAGAGGGGEPGAAVVAAASSPFPSAAAKLVAVVASGALAASYLAPRVEQAQHRGPSQSAHPTVPIHGPGTLAVGGGTRALLAGDFVSTSAVPTSSGAGPGRASSGDAERGRHGGGGPSSGRRGPGPSSGDGPSVGSGSGDGGHGSDGGGPGASSTSLAADGGGSGGGPGPDRPSGDGSSGSGHGTSDGLQPSTTNESGLGPAATSTGGSSSQSSGTSGGGSGSGSGSGGDPGTGSAGGGDANAVSSSSSGSGSALTQTNSGSGRDLLPGSDSSAP